MTDASTTQISVDRLTGIVAFARAASLGSYTATARSLSISPSAVSRSVQRLEARLGVPLFTRTTRSLALTPEGRDLHERALRLLEAAVDIEQAAMVAQSTPSGTLKIAAPIPVGTHLLGPALPGFRARFPELAVDLRLSDRRIDLVEEGFDVAIRVGPMEDSALLSKRLAAHTLTPYASPAYLERRGTPLHPDDLAAHDCVVFRGQNSGQVVRWPFRVGSRDLEIAPVPTITVDVGDAVMAVLAAGGGIGLAPHYLAAPYVARGTLVPVLSRFVVERSSITAVWPESRRSNPGVRAFLALLENVFATIA